MAGLKKAFFNYTGYGKTKIVLDYIQAHPEIKRVLIISKGDIIKESWPNEIAKWNFPFTYTYIDGTVSKKKKLDRVYGSYDILGVTPGLLGWFTENKFFKLTKKEMKYDLVVFDESDMFKNSQTQRFKDVKKWIAQVPNVFIMTATPMPNTIEDLWSQIYLIDETPYRLGNNITAFRKEYGDEYVISGPPGQRNQYAYIYQPSAVSAIMDKIKDICEVNLVKPKNLFPQPIFKIIKIKPDPETAKLLATLESKYVVEVNNILVTAQNYNKSLTKLQQLSNGFIYTDDGQALNVNDLKFKYIRQRLESSSTPILCTYSFIPDKEKLLTLPGAKLITSEEEWNDNQIPLGIIYSNKAGLNLQFSECREMIWYSPIWDARAWEQTISRLVRRGQKYKVTIEILVVEGSVEDIIFSRMKDKLAFMYKTFKPLEGSTGGT